MMEMGKKTDYIECGLVRPEAVAEGVRESNGCAMRTVRCVNLRPAPGADGRPVLQGVGRPRRLCGTRLECVGVLPGPDGGDAVVLWREPEVWVLAPGEAEPEMAGSIRGTLFGCTLCGKKLLLCSSEGMWQLEYGADGSGLCLGRVPQAEDYHGITLRVSHHSILRSTVPSCTLHREYLPGETVVDGADSRLLGRDIGEAYERLCDSARGQGCFVQPVIARYKVYDSTMHELYCSAPVLLGHPDGLQCSETLFLRSLDRRKVESYELTAQTWQVELHIPAGLPAGAAYAAVFVSPQFHPYDPDGGCAVALSRSPGSANEFGHIVLPGTERTEALVRQTLGNLSALERPAGSFGIGPNAGVVTISNGAPDDVRSEIKILDKAWKHHAVKSGALQRRLSPPNSFTARRGCAGPAGVLWGGMRSRRYGGYPLQQLAVQTEPRDWEAWIKVNFADGSSVLWTGEGVDSAPVLMNPVLSYPSSDAINMVIGIMYRGRPACEQSFTLTADPVSDTASYIHRSLAPFELQRAEDGQTKKPAVPEKWTDYADTLVLASVTSPLLPCAVYNPGMGGINALVAAGGSQSAWDFGRSRFYAFCSGGILAVNSTEGLGRMAATPVDYRVCPGPGAVTVADGAVWAVASGDLIRLQGNKAVTERNDCGYTALAWRGTRRELLGMRADGTLEASSSDFGMSRFELNYRLSALQMYSPHGSMVILSTSEGLYNLAEEGVSTMLDVEWVVNLSHLQAAAALSGIVADIGADRFSGTVSISRRNGAVVAPSADMGLIIKGAIHSPVGSRIICRPARGWQLRVAGNASNITISEVLVSYEKYSGYNK